MSWQTVTDGLIFVFGMLTAFALSIVVEAKSSAYARNFEKSLRNWDHRAARFDEHCRSAGVRDRRNMLPGRWSS